MRYKISTESDVIEENFGRFDGSDVQFEDMPFLYERRSDLRGVVLRGIGVDVISYIVFFLFHHIYLKRHLMIQARIVYFS
jgi:hypothetical protein